MGWSRLTPPKPSLPSDSPIIREVALIERARPHEGELSLPGGRRRRCTGPIPFWVGHPNDADPSRIELATNFTSAYRDRFHRISVVAAAIAHVMYTPTVPA